MKFKSKILCLLLVLVMLLSVSAAAAVNENTTMSFKEDSTDQMSVNVETGNEILGISNNEENLCATYDGTFNALQDKIDNAAGVLVLENDYANTDNFNQNGISISKSLTIDGNGYTIDALKKGRIFQVTASNVILKNINFINGNIYGSGSTSRGGGAVYWTGSNGILSGCNFTNNDCSGYSHGGAVYWSGSNGILSGCNFTNNSAMYIGGAVYWTGSNGVLNDSNFIDNSAEYGGAVYWRGDNGTLSGSNFTDNGAGYRASVAGGAVYWFADNGNLTDSTFINNSAQTGGAVFWSFNVYNGVLSGSSFINNSAFVGGAVYWHVNAYNGVLSGSSFTGNNVTFGGAVYWGGDNGTLSGSNFINNSASGSTGYSGDGGAVAWYGANGVLGNCSFKHSSATQGGAVAWYSANGVLGNCSFEYCTATRNGGAIMYGVEGVLSNCSFKYCSARNGGAIMYAVNGVLDNCSFIGCNATWGGAIYLPSGSLNVNRSNFTNNFATIHGGAIAFNTGTTGSVDNCNFTNNKALSYGGAINIFSGRVNNSNFTKNSGSHGGAVRFNTTEGNVTDCNFDNNFASSNGGGIYFVDSGNVVNCNFHDNKALNAKEAFGGGIYFNSGSGSLDNCTFANNSASNSGGAIAFNTGTTGSIDNCNFTNNKALSNGGAINIFSGRVNNSNFTNNNAKWGGAVRFNTEGNVTDCNFDNNSATSFGGGINFAVTTANVLNCNLNDNKAVSGGGIYFASGSGSLDNCTFANNSASNSGGGIIFINGTKEGSLVNCSFTDNKASKFGGAGYFNSTTVSLYDCNFTENSAQYGGAVCIDKDGNLNGCSFTKNSASKNGGGIYFNDTTKATKANVVNCNIDNNSAQYGGGIFLNSSEAKLDNCNFTNNLATAVHGGGILFSSDGSLDNCNFINNNATEYGGAGIFYSDTVSLNNCNFTENYASYAGAVCFIDNGTVMNCSFTNNSATRERGGGIYFNDSAKAIVVDCNFTGNSAKYGGGIFIFADDGKLENCIFTNNFATTHGGGIFFYSGVGSLVNCIFTNNSASRYGGGIYFAGLGNVVNSNFTNNRGVQGGAIYLAEDSSVDVNKSKFIDNSALNVGGAIASYGSGNLINCNFTNNNASNYGGAVYWRSISVSQDENRFLANISDSRFISNKARYGGAVHVFNIKTKIISSYFENNSAIHSGGLSVRVSNVTVANSNFTDNSAVHGGGAIGNDGRNPDKVYVEIKYSNFDKNHANNYGGALSLERVLVDNSNFYNNSAVFGGAIYSISPKVISSTFRNNNASELGNNIFAINKADISNVRSMDIYNNNLIESIIYTHQGSSPYKITYGGKTYDAFAVEGNLIIPEGRTGDVYSVDPSLKLVRNVLDSSDVSGYVENLLYKYFKGELSYNVASDRINRAVYNNSAINANDNAPRVEYIGNNMVNVYEYISLITPSSNTNFVFLKNTTQTLNQTLTKEALNKTAFVGDIVKFRINVTNGNNFTLPDVFVKDVFNDTEFEYLRNESKDNWAYNVNSKVFTLKSLSPSTTSTLILTFKVKINGTLTNTAVSGIGESETVKNSTNITVFNPQLAIEKKYIDSTVVLGKIARFEINVRNNGDTDLHDVKVTENPDQSLVFDSYDENPLWNYSFENNKHVWTLVNPLAPGESVQLFVNFNTTETGRLLNNVSVESSETNKSTTGSAVDVIKAEFKVEKIVLTPKVALGEQVRYEIVVHNTGEADLTNITVEEMPDASLIFDHVDSGRFNHSVVSGKHRWTLDKLTNGTSEGFIIYFNTTASGNVSNKIAVKSDEVPEVIISNNTTVLLPAFTVKKISLPQTVVLGQSATFQIVIENTGKAELTNVYFTEDSFDGLIFDSAVGAKNWTHKFENAKHTWTFNDVLEPGEIIWLTLRFNTTDSGNFTNFISAGSDQTEILTANTTVNVLKPEFKVEKIVLTPLKVALGEQVIYEIVIHNTGEADLTNIVVEEMPDASLIFDHVDSGRFKYSVVPGKYIWTLDKLAKGTYEGFKLYFNTTAVGNVSNRISVKSDEIPEEIISSNNTTVLIPAFTVEKICLYPNVLVGNQTQFEIVITNTGKIELTNVYFTEDSFDGLIYDSAVGEGIWTHKFENGKHTWTLNDVLEPDEIIGLILIFNTTAKGNYTNFVSAGSDQTEALFDSATVHVYEGKVPEPPVQNSTSMDVFKTVITQEPVLGGQITFEIVIHNTGNTNLENVKISEILPEGLVYDHFVDYLNLWTYNNDLTWSATRAIVPGQYVGFFVTFNTTKAGKSVNNVVVSADKANSTSANTSFEVLNPAFTIEKILVEDNIVNGGQATFEIVIHNTGNAPLTNVTVKEYDFKDLIYNNFADYLGLWTYNGDLSWTMNSKLHPGEYAELLIIFNTTAAGNFTNFASAESGETGILIANATLHVIDDKKPDPEHNSSNDYKMDVFKIVITQEAVLGGQITFEIVVHNTGNKNLENVKISEILPEGLIYDHFVDNIDLWTYNGDLTWSATRAIVPGEYAGFFITFNTTKAGKSVNNVNVSADNTNSTGANTSFEILNPDFTIEKILIKDNIANGAQATFEIVIHNTGNAPLTNMIVREYFSEGLIYDHFVDYLDLWTYNGDLTWTMNSKLVPGEYVGFFVTFNTTKDGVFTNIVVANSTECDNRFSNNVSVSVHNETVDIRQICLTPLVIVGEQAIFEITVQNTGKINIDKLKLSEFDFEGLIYDHYMDYLGHWINDGITWTLNTTLVPGEVTSLFVVFNTTRVGNFTNVVLANNDVLDTNELLSANSLEDGIYVSADVEVVKPEYTIEKVALNKTANIGDEVIFEIIVHNTGKVNITNITVRDIPSDGLEYLRFVDGENFWFKNGDLSWNLIGNLTSGEYSIFYVVFNATKAGTLENTLESDNLTSKATVEVNNPVVPTNPGLIIEAEIITDPVTGKQVLKVTVINTGDVDLDNVFVRPKLPEGLRYGDYYSYDSVWNFNNGAFDLEGILKVAESKSFYIEILGEPGEYLIPIDGGYNNTVTDSTEVFVKILDNSTPGNVTPEDNVKPLKSSIAAGDNATGNPLLMVLVVLIALGITRFRKRD